MHYFPKRVHRCRILVHFMSGYTFVSGVSHLGPPKTLSAAKVLVSFNFQNDSMSLRVSETVNSLDPDYLRRSMSHVVIKRHAMIDEIEKMLSVYTGSHFQRNTSSIHNISTIFAGILFNGI